jgi:putative transposase
MGYYHHSPLDGILFIRMPLSITIAVFTKKGTRYNEIDIKKIHMARAYSEDLRIRIVKAYEQGLGSIREIAQQFQVGKTFVSKLLQRWQEKGSVSPLPQGGGVKSKLESVHLEKLQKMVEEKNDITLAELKEGLKQSTGLEISVPTVHRGLEKLGLSRKKKHFTTLSKNQKK